MITWSVPARIDLDQFCLSTFDIFYLYNIPKNTGQAILHCVEVWTIFLSISAITITMMYIN